MSTNIPGPAYLVRTPRLVLRCWHPSDAPLLREAVAANLEHLRPWMSWAQQVSDLQTQIGTLRRMRGEFDLDKDYVYGILSPDERQVLGGTGLHPLGSPEEVHIGYWIDHQHHRHGLASEAAGAMARVAIEINGVRRVEIRCAPHNVASAGVARKLGFTHERTDETMSDTGETRLTMIWTLYPDQLGQSAAANVVIEAYDVAGRAIR